MENQYLLDLKCSNHNRIAAILGEVERQILLLCLIRYAAVVGMAMAVLYWQYVLPDRIEMLVFRYMLMIGSVA